MPTDANIWECTNEMVRLGQIYNKTIALDLLLPEMNKPKRTTLNRELELWKK